MCSQILAFILFTLTFINVNCEISNLQNIVIPFSSVQNSFENNKITPRIYGGKTARPHQFPFQVGLRATVLADGGLRSYCGGSLISKSHVLTAGHCIYTFLYTRLANGSIDVQYGKRAWVHYIDVILGAHNIDNGQEEKHQTYNLHVSQCKLHPHYDPYYFANDIAIINLPEPAFLNDKVQIIKLPPKNFPRNLVGKIITTSGWGLTDREEDKKLLQYITTEVQTFEYCVKEGLSHHQSDDTLICTHNNRSASMCIGDSGSPNTIEGDNGVPILVGISSFMNYKGCGVSPIGLTRVSAYLDWIAKETGLQV